MNTEIKHSLELKRNIMLAHGLRLTDQELDKMQLYKSNDGSEGFLIRFQAYVNTKGWRMHHGHIA